MASEVERDNPDMDDLGTLDPEELKDELELPGDEPSEPALQAEEALPTKTSSEQSEESEQSETPEDSEPKSPDWFRRETAKIRQRRRELEEEARKKDEEIARLQALLNPEPAVPEEPAGPVTLTTPVEENDEGEQYVNMQIPDELRGLSETQIRKIIAEQMKPDPEQLEAQRIQHEAHRMGQQWVSEGNAEIRNQALQRIGGVYEFIEQLYVEAASKRNLNPKQLSYDQRAQILSEDGIRDMVSRDAPDIHDVDELLDASLGQSLGKMKKWLNTYIQGRETTESPDEVDPATVELPAPPPRSMAARGAPQAAPGAKKKGTARLDQLIEKEDEWGSLSPEEKREFDNLVKELT